MGRKHKTTSAGAAAKSGGAASAAVVDEARDGTTPVTPATMERGTGSTMGQLITEASFLHPGGPSFIESPFGQRYIARKPKAIISGDILVRSSTWAFDIQGYQDYGTFTLGVPRGVQDGNGLLRDWYVLTRDQAKRALKYKHLPTTLTDVNMLKYYMNVYYYVLANLTTLLNLNRLPQYNAGFAVITAYLPGYMARVTRLWRRLASIPMAPFLKSHAIRNGMIVGIDGILAPTMRVWSHKFLLAAGSGGPTITDINATGAGAISSSTHIATLVSNLEAAERWLEQGTAAIAVDFTAVKDLIDMTADIVPGAWSPGLPKPESLPGISPDTTVMTDLLRRAVYRKDIVGAGTDRWIIFPVPGLAEMGSRIPVVGYGAPHPVYDFTLLGASKYGVFNAGTSLLSADVDSDVRLTGTDFWLADNLTLASQDIRDMFGVTGPAIMESVNAAPLGAASTVGDAIDSGIAASIRGYILWDKLRMIHPWDLMRYGDRDAWASLWPRIIDENIYAYKMFQEPEDLGENYGEFLASSLGVPYMKASS